MDRKRRHHRVTEGIVRLVGLVGIFLAACTPHEPRTPKAVFIIVDGIPADVIEATDTPAIDAVSAIGGYTRAYIGGAIGDISESPTVSSVGYASLVTGTWANKHNVWDNNISAPNYAYWDIFRIAKEHDPTLKTAVFSTWTDNRTKLLGNGLAEAGGDKLDYYFDLLEAGFERLSHEEQSQQIRQIDTLSAINASDYIAAQGPELSWVYLQYTDDVAHLYGDSPEFTNAVRFMDRQIGRVWDSIRERQARFNEDWLLIVTTDHGRDAETGMDHGGQSERERTIWIATNSDHLNDRFGQLPGIVDILPSIATHLDLDIPTAIERQLDGESFIDQGP